MKSEINVQDSFLNEIRKKEIKVTVYLTNGFRLSGIVEGFDSFTVIIQTDKEQQMIYKHAISTIIPEKKVKNLFK